MATKDITDRQVCEAFDRWRNPYNFGVGKMADSFLAEMTGQCEKVCERAMERAYRRGLVECGVTLRSGWLTDKGKALLSQKE